MSTISYSDEIYDPITYEIMVDPVLASNGISYERQHIEEWYRISKTLPSGEVVDSLELESNHVLKDKINEYFPIKDEIRNPNQNPGAPCRTIAGFAPKVFEHIDGLSSLFNKLEWQPPQLVVIGGEGVGKSTLLERLTGYPVFPRSKGRSTRVPIRVQLRRGPTLIPQLSHGKCLSRDASQITIDILHPNSEPIAMSSAMELITNRMELILEQFGEGPKVGINADYEICLRLQNPTVPNIDIVDLPGLVSVSVNEDDPQLQQKTTELARRYIQAYKDISLFIVVVPVTSSVQQSLGMKLIQEFNIFDKCLGVLTKADVFRSEDDDVDDATALSAIVNCTARGSLPLGHGWILVSSRQPNSSTTLSHASRLAMVEQMECKHLGQLVPLLVSEGQASLSAVRVIVGKMYESYLSRSWAQKTVRLLLDRLSSIRRLISDLGRPGEGDVEFSSHRHMEQIILTRATRITQEMSWHTLASDWLNSFTDELTGNVNINLEAMFGNLSSAIEHAETTRTSMCMMLTNHPWLGMILNECDAATTPAASWVRTALAADSSALRLGRFRRAIDALVSAVEKRARTSYLLDLATDLNRLVGKLKDPLETFTVQPFPEVPSIYLVKGPTAAEVACTVAQLIFIHLIQPLASGNGSGNGNGGCIFQDVVSLDVLLLDDETQSVRMELVEEANKIELAIVEVAKLNLESVCEDLAYDEDIDSNVYSHVLRTMYTAGFNVSALLGAGLQPKIIVESGLFDMEMGVAFRIITQEVEIVIGDTSTTSTNTTTNYNNNDTGTTRNIYCNSSSISKAAEGALTGIVSVSVEGNGVEETVTVTVTSMAEEADREENEEYESDFEDDDSMSMSPPSAARKARGAGHSLGLLTGPAFTVTDISTVLGASNECTSSHTSTTTPTAVPLPPSERDSFLSGMLEALTEKIVITAAEDKASDFHQELSSTDIFTIFLKNNELSSLAMELCHIAKTEAATITASDSVDVSSSSSCTFSTLSTTIEANKEGTFGEALPTTTTNTATATTTTMATATIDFKRSIRRILRRVKPKFRVSHPAAIALSAFLVNTLRTVHQKCVELESDSDWERVDEHARGYSNRVQALIQTVHNMFPSEMGIFIVNRAQKVLEEYNSNVLK